MKINEKNLCMFATTPPVDLEGWLNKRGELNKSWQRRWFVLKGNLLFYFEKRGDKEPLGMIILEGCTVELAEEGEQYCFQIIFHGSNNRTYYLSTESQSNMEQWMKALTCAGYDYMKLMVAELQRQLDEIEGQCKEKTPNSTPLHVPPKAPPRRQNPFNKPLSTEYATTADISNSGGGDGGGGGSNADNTISTGNGSTSTPVAVRRKAPAPPVQSPAKEACSPAPAVESNATKAAINGPAQGDAGQQLAELLTAPKSRRQVVTATKSSDAIASMTTEQSGAGTTIASTRSADQVDGIGERVPIERGPVPSFSFETMHSALGIPVLADLSKWNAGQTDQQQEQQHQQQQQQQQQRACLEISTETV